MVEKLPSLVWCVPFDNAFFYLTERLNSSCGLLLLFSCREIVIAPFLSSFFLFLFVFLLLDSDSDPGGSLIMRMSAELEHCGSELYYSRRPEPETPK